jgi:hypothetical protein
MPVQKIKTIVEFNERGIKRLLLNFIKEKIHIVKKLKGFENGIKHFFIVYGGGTPGYLTPHHFYPSFRDYVAKEYPDFIAFPSTAPWDFYNLIEKHGLLPNYRRNAGAGLAHVCWKRSRGSELGWFDIKEILLDFFKQNTVEKIGEINLFFKVSKDDLGCQPGFLSVFNAYVKHKFSKDQEFLDVPERKLLYAVRVLFPGILKNKTSLAPIHGTYLTKRGALYFKDLAWNNSAFMVSFREIKVNEKQIKKPKY